jgi:hypothetical protein
MLIIFSNLISLISVNTIVILKYLQILFYFRKFFLKKSLKRLKKIEDFVSVIHMLGNMEFSTVE